jgi:hypothetical protein
VSWYKYQNNRNYWILDGCSTQIIEFWGPVAMYGPNFDRKLMDFGRVLDVSGHAINAGILTHTRQVKASAVKDITQKNRILTVLERHMC